MAGRSSNWWNSMSAKAKREYIKAHPNSIYAKGGKSKAPARKTNTVSTKKPSKKLTDRNLGARKGAGKAMDKGPKAPQVRAKKTLTKPSAPKTRSVSPSKGPSFKKDPSKAKAQQAASRGTDKWNRAIKNPKPPKVKKPKPPKTTAPKARKPRTIEQKIKLQKPKLSSRNKAVHGFRARWNRRRGLR